jgi:plastocyanin
MNNKIIIGVVLAIMVIGGFYYFAQNLYQQPATGGPTQAPAKIEANTITIQNFAFNPGTLTVKQGTKVTWNNQDSAIHRIKSGDFNSQDLSQGDKFEFTFKNKGSFDYICGIHPSMTGKIVVE